MVTDSYHTGLSLSEQLTDIEYQYDEMSTVKEWNNTAEFRELLGLETVSLLSKNGRVQRTVRTGNSQLAE